MAVEKKYVSPRQKMINLIYVVLMAMLAINVSPEVLDGYYLIQESLNDAINNSSSENESIYQDFEKQMKLNPTKVGTWYEKAEMVRRESDSLYNYIEILKQDIAREADGSREATDPVNEVMFNPATLRGQALCQSINQYRNNILSLVNDSQKNFLRENLLKTESSNDNTSWESELFEDKPSVVAAAMLTKLQSDIKYAESSVLHILADNIDRTDVRVNELTAFVIPESNMVIRGNSYKANIILAAVDSTKVPSIYLKNGNGVDDIHKLNNSMFERYCGQTGRFTLNGYILTKNKEGKTIRCGFSQPYSVIEPSATVSADLTNILYIGYDNPVSVSVPGARNEDIYATITGGSIRETSKGKYIVRPSGTGNKATIKVFMKNQGHEQMMASYDFKVRKLPEPSPYIAIAGTRFQSGKIGRQDLLTTTKLSAAIDDGILDVPFRVTGFDMVAFDGIGNAIPTSSNGASFSEAQKSAIRNMQRGQRFFITHVRAVGPDNTEREINASMEVVIK